MLRGCDRTRLNPRNASSLLLASTRRRLGTDDERIIALRQDASGVQMLEGCEIVQLIQTVFRTALLSVRFVGLKNGGSTRGIVKAIQFLQGLAHTRRRDYTFFDPKTHPSRFEKSSSESMNTEGFFTSLTRSSLIIRASTRRSSPSSFTTACGVFASST